MIAAGTFWTMRGASVIAKMVTAPTAIAVQLHNSGDMSPRARGTFLGKPSSFGNCPIAMTTATPDR